MVYNSIQDILDSTDKQGIQRKLGELGVKYHHASGEQKLAELLFESTGGSTSKEVKTSTKSSSNLSEWEKLGQTVAKKTSRIKKAGRTKTRHYIHKWFNVNLSPNGINKNGKKMRYAKGLASLVVSEQVMESDIFDLGYIKFKGIEGTTFDMNGFIGRSILSTADETLQEYIETHKSFGNLFVLYDKEELTRQELADDVKLTAIKYGIHNASDEDLVSTLSYLNMRNGRNNFKELFAITDKGSLRLKALKYANQDPDRFLETTASKEAKVIMLVNLAREFNMITVSSDETQVMLSDNGKVVCNSSRSSDWQEDLKDFLFTPEGMPLAQKMEVLTGYRVL